MDINYFKILPVPKKTTSVFDKNFLTVVIGKYCFFFFNTFYTFKLNENLSLFVPVVELRVDSRLLSL